MAQRTLIFLAGLLWAAGASAQTTRVRGQVTDAADGKPLQFVSVVFPGTTTGITTDEQGIYALETRDTVSRVQASMVGYASQTKPLIQGGFNQIDFALEAEREQGLSPREAIFEACLLRFRPILMTTLAALFGAIPLAIGSGDGAELRQPLGIAIVGGLILSQILTLYTTPVVFVMLDKLRKTPAAAPQACLDAAR